MQYMKYVVLVLLLFSITIVQAQDMTCPGIVHEALDRIDENCAGTGRNQACYGHSSLEAEIVGNAQFDAVGDIADLQDIARLALTGMNVQAGEWGVALMNVQANIPDTLPGQNVIFLLFGDTTIENANVSKSDTPTTPVTTSTDQGTVTVSPVGSSHINMRAGPGTEFAVVAVFRANTSARVDERNDDGSWVRVVLQDGRSGWVYAAFLTVEGSVSGVSTGDAQGSSQSTIALGESRQGRITNQTYEQYYTFSAAAGDVISVTMQADNDSLDAYLRILDAQGTILAENDDGSGLNRSYDSAIRGYSVPETGTYTIVATRYGAADGSSEGAYTLELTSDTESLYGAPMQAFYITSGIGDAACAEAPESGMLIQTPEGAGEIRILVNEVQVDLGSTVFIQSSPNADMQLSVLHGRARVESFGAAQFVPEGAMVSIPMTDGVASAPPTEPQPYNQDHLLPLPVNILPQPITIAQPSDLSVLVGGEVTIKLVWDSAADIDLYLTEPNGNTIYYGSPSSFSGAQLDVDANAGCSTSARSEENITWPTGQPRLGTYTVGVEEWSNCDASATNWTLTVQIGSEIILSESGTGNANFTFQR